MAYTDEEFKRLLDVLASDLLEAEHHYRLYHNLQKSLEEYEGEINTYIGFWRLTFNAHCEACLLHLCRAYDNHQKKNKNDKKGILSLQSLLQIIQGNTEIFDVARFRERQRENPYVDSLAQDNRKPPDEQIQKDLKDVLDENNPLVRKLSKLRGSRIAHTDRNLILAGKDDPAPLTWSEVKELINTGLRILNYYRELFEASIDSPMLIGENDYEQVLKIIRIGSKAIDFSLDIEYAHDENRGVLKPTDITSKTTDFVNDVLYSLYGYKLQPLNQATQKRLADKEETTKRAKFHKALLASGLVKQLKQPSYSLQTEPRLIQVQGKPVSETIIEERR